MDVRLAGVHRADVADLCDCEQLLVISCGEILRPVDLMPCVHLTERIVAD
jgi:hypothetical protein